jgi:hypothetical protein
MRIISGARGRAEMSASGVRGDQAAFGFGDGEGTIKGRMMSFTKLIF